MELQSNISSVGTSQNQPVLDLSDNKPSNIEELVPEKKSLTPLFLFLTLLFLALIAGGIYYFYTIVKKDLYVEFDKIITNYSNLEKNYKEISVVYDKTPTTPNQSDVNVLGIEEDLYINLDRQVSEKINDSMQLLELINSSLSKIEQDYKTYYFFKPLLPQINKLIYDTKIYNTETLSLLDYYNKLSAFGINAKSSGYEIGMAIQEAITRQADDTSVNNYSSKLRKLDELYLQIKNLKTDNIPEELKTEHDKIISEYDEETQIFRDIEKALINKDNNELIKALNSTILQATTAQEISLTNHKNFWSQNSLILQASSFKIRWQEIR